MTGNHLGEEGIPTVKDLMQDMDKVDQLGSFRYFVSLTIILFLGNLLCMVPEY